MFPQFFLLRKADPDPRPSRSPDWDVAPPECITSASKCGLVKCLAFQAWWGQDAPSWREFCLGSLPPIPETFASRTAQRKSGRHAMRSKPESPTCPKIVDVTALCWRCQFRQTLRWRFTNEFFREAGFVLARSARLP